MSVTSSITFATPSDFTYDTDDIVVSGGSALLKIGDLPDQHFIQSFVSDSGFTYDNTKTEFTGTLCRQKDQRPTGATFGASYTTDINGNWGNGVLTGTAVGGATVSGGKLDLNGGSKYVRYSGTDNTNCLQTGCIRFKFTPNYTGIPLATKGIFAISAAFGDYIRYTGVRHSVSNGYIEISILDNTGAAIVSAYLPEWSPISGIEYEFEMNYDVTSGATRLFINGVQHGTTQTGTGTRTGAMASLVVGAHYAGGSQADGLIDDFEIFSTVQHTANYTPGYAVSDTIYAETNITCPELHYIGAGTLMAFESMTSTLVNDPKLSIQIGRSGIYLYWNGAAWATSDGSYAQSNTMADFNAHCTTIDIEGEIYGQPRVHFGASSTQQSITSFDVIVVGQTYQTTNPIISINAPIYNEGLVSFTPTIVVSGSDTIKFILSKNSTDYYHNGTTWVASNGTYSQSNTYAEINTNISTFNASANILTYIKCILHSDTGVSTPSISALSVVYDFYGGTVTAPSKCIVFGYLYDENGLPISGATINISTNKKTSIYNNDVVISFEDIVSVVTDSDGYWDKELIETSKMTEVKYIFTFSCDSSSREYKRSVPNLVSCNFGDLSA